jgi:CobQ-like glutamine amidotransferase family enzyme
MKIEVLYPELCNLYGDQANIRVLRLALPDAEFFFTELKDRPVFAEDDDISLIYMGSMTERSQELVAAALLPYRDRIEELIKRQVVFFITGNALEIFGNYIDDGAGKRLEMLGIFNTFALRDMQNRFNSLYLGTFIDISIVGFKSQFSHTHGDDGDGFMQTIRGCGRNPATLKEGFLRNRFMATYVLGPLLVLNPLLLRLLLDLLGEKTAAIPFERAAMDAYALRLKEFTDPGTGFEY